LKYLNQAWANDRNQASSSFDGAGSRPRRGALVQALHPEENASSKKENLQKGDIRTGCSISHSLKKARRQPMGVCHVSGKFKPCGLQFIRTYVR
jgi:hypothetical protein